MNKPATLELCERLEKLAEWHYQRSKNTPSRYDFHMTAYEDIRSLIIPLPVLEDE